MSQIIANTRTTNFEKLRLTVRYWLLGRNYTLALRAMEFAARYHTGVRKDGSPEFSHQVWQVAYARTFVDLLLYPEETLATIFLHDVVEDYNVPLSEIEREFGPRVAASIDRMSKEIQGRKKSSETYFGELALCPIASISKGIDRIHNHQTMRHAFKLLKKIDYLDETEQHILPMFKEARRRFPEQEAVYENIKHMLITQMELYAYALSENPLGDEVKCGTQP
jgi:(p)ppGpp synthase/HD superfamily hydrolase